MAAIFGGVAGAESNRSQRVSDGYRHPLAGIYRLLVVRSLVDEERPERIRPDMNPYLLAFYDRS